MRASGESAVICADDPADNAWLGDTVDLDSQVIVSGGSRDSTVAQEAGATDYLSKPIALKDLLSVAKEYLG